MPATCAFLSMCWLLAFNRGCDWCCGDQMLGRASSLLCSCSPVWGRVCSPAVEVVVPSSVSELWCEVDSTGVLPLGEELLSIPPPKHSVDAPLALALSLQRYRWYNSTKATKRGLRLQPCFQCPVAPEDLLRFQPCRGLWATHWGLHTPRAPTGGAMPLCER